MCVQDTKTTLPGLKNVKKITGVYKIFDFNETF